MKSSKGWAIVNKKSGEIAQYQDDASELLEIHRTRAVARGNKARWFSSKDYTIVQIAIIEVTK